MTELQQVPFEELSAPFPLKCIDFLIPRSFKRGDKDYAFALPFVDARAVMNRLDAVVGPGNWQNAYAAGPSGGNLCGISLKVNGEWITKWDGAENTDFEETKGGLSSAFKRAAVLWGIGRYLYNVDPPVVEVEVSQSARGKQNIRMLSKPLLPKEFLTKEDQERFYGNLKGADTVAKVSPQPKPVAQPAPAKAAKVQPPASGNEAPRTLSDAIAAAEAIPITGAATEAAKARIVPEGVPMAGSALGDMMNDPQFGKAVLLFLAQKGPNRAGKMYTPKTDGDKAVCSAAAYLLRTMDEVPAAA